MSNKIDAPYCRYVSSLASNHPHRIYHDTQYGFSIYDDNELFGRLILEINQAGLSWLTILKKYDNFRYAYSEFSIEKVAGYGCQDIKRLLGDKGIVRNERKIDAVIYNANRILSIQEEFGSFFRWLDMNRDKGLNCWVVLFRKAFKFTGIEITREFLMSTGFIVGAHDGNCPVSYII